MKKNSLALLASMAAVAGGGLMSFGSFFLPRAMKPFVIGPKKTAKDLAQYDSKAFKHKFTGQVREVHVAPTYVSFFQERRKMVTYIRRDFRKALDWLRNAEEVTV